jgi:hypothetical protein
MKTDNSRILTINAGSSSIRFALYKTGGFLQRGLYGRVDRIGLSETNLTFYDPATSWRDSRGFGSDVLLDGWLTFSTREFPANGCICRNHDGVDQLYSIRAATPRSS